MADEPFGRTRINRQRSRWVYVAAAIFLLFVVLSPEFRRQVLDRMADRPAADATGPTVESDMGRRTEVEKTAPRSPPSNPKTSVANDQASAEKRPAPPASPPVSSKAPGPQKSPAGTQPSQPVLGTLTEIRKGVFRSSAGLVYRSGSVDGHRIDHVLRHAADDRDKPVHGVFLGSRDEIFALIDEGYQIALKRGPPTVKTEQEGDRTVHRIDMKRKIGYLGGQVGNRKNQPPCRLLQLVLEDDAVITAFPTDR